MDDFITEELPHDFDPSAPEQPLMVNESIRSDDSFEFGRDELNKLGFSPERSRWFSQKSLLVFLTNGDTNIVAPGKNIIVVETATGNKHDYLALSPFDIDNTDNQLPDNLQPNKRKMSGITIAVSQATDFLRDKVRKLRPSQNPENNVHLTTDHSVRLTDYHQPLNIYVLAAGSLPLVPTLDDLQHCLDETTETGEKPAFKLALKPVRNGWQVAELDPNPKIG